MSFKAHAPKGSTPNCADSSRTFFIFIEKAAYRMSIWYQLPVCHWARA